MLRSLKRAHALDAYHPQLHSCLIKFALSVQKADSSDETLQKVSRLT